MIHSSNSGNRTISFDRLIGDGEHARRNCKAKRPGSIEIDNELELGWPLHRQIGWVGTFKDLANKNRLPAMYGLREDAAAGGLLAYGPKYAELYRRAAGYVDKRLCFRRPFFFQPRILCLTLRLSPTEKFFFEWRCTQQLTLKRESEKRFDGQLIGSTSCNAHDGKARSIFCSGWT
jgi:hypothetical protein